MAQLGSPGHDAVPIGEVVAPPFAKTPDPSALFRDRSARLRDLAPGHRLGAYLTFLAGLTEVQAALAEDLPPPDLPDAEALARSRAHGMPALDRERFPHDPACRDTLRRFFAGASAIEMPAESRQALSAIASADDETLAWMVQNVVRDSIPAHDAAPHVFVAAGTALHAARCASAVDASWLVPVGEGACPACGSAPVSSVIVGWEGAHGARFCVCSLCGTLWNAVRIRCTACGSTKGISYQELDDPEAAEGAVKAECCSECRTYLKVMQQAKHPALDPVADDVATLALDRLLAEDEDLRRSGRNPYLLGY
ncbi:formate dehydrogenase accessory protein FdhE [Enterovirga rhinocerotis]|uniref:Protein FdhE homolog n=1 Tax=Enterovirga rhinocerotis TaxID=1339210 RepID=A0A4R7BH18_9HYPH|nr:formate dehydrogenase accessory protein FdhE [Enterovirga rhinocerotis]TDR84560.1 Tat proofreading chaperone FdhE [Enterovirga rhinocerotis]